MRLYIANCSQQDHILNYRVPEISSPLTRPIPIGTQVNLGDMTDPQNEAVIAQLRKYGLLSAGELSRANGVVPLVFSTGSPVKSEVMARVMAHNSGVLNMRGVEIRKEAAIAAAGRVAEISPSLKAFESSVVEESHGNGPASDPISEGFRIERTPSVNPDVPKKRRGKRAA